MRSAYKILIGKAEETRLSGRCRRKQENGFKRTKK
jgi:hypothetical protein